MKMRCATYCDKFVMLKVYQGVSMSSCCAGHRAGASMVAANPRSQHRKKEAVISMFLLNVSIWEIANCSTRDESRCSLMWCCCGRYFQGEWGGLTCFWTQV